MARRHIPRKLSAAEVRDSPLPILDTFMIEAPPKPKCRRRYQRALPTIAPMVRAMIECIDAEGAAAKPAGVLCGLVGSN
jgi:hypothetical protein